MAGESLAKEFCEEMTCPVCLEYFTDPVIAECGHNFCRACLAQCWGEPDRNASCCPQCKEPVEAEQCNLRPNQQLANIVEISKKFSLHEAKGTGGEGGVCERHQEPLKLFCSDDEAPICVVCDRSEEHREHRVIPMDEATEEYKKKIQAQLQSLKKERETLVEQKVAEEQRSQGHREHLEVQKQEITSLFEQMHKFLEKKEHFWLTELAVLEKEIKNRQEENMTRLSEKISRLSDLIKNVEVKCRQPPNEFLQDIRCTLSRCQQHVRQRLELSPGLEWRLRRDCPQSSVLKKAMEEFEGLLNRAPSKVNVTLDPKTANLELVISEDLKSVRRGSSKQELPDSPERFDARRCVLGHERFTSGRHWWEVEVENRIMGQWWAVGVARESVPRKRAFRSSLNVGIWAVRKSSSGSHQVWALTFPEQTPIDLSRELKTIRVFLDYEEGRVEFFDADTDSLIFTFPRASFSGEGILPYFWVGWKARVTFSCDHKLLSLH